MKRPNILWICSDQQRWDMIGHGGNRAMHTPCLDALAAAGVHCATAICQSPACSPSRASFLTGRYPRTTRCRANGQALPADEVPVGRRLRDAGYFCGLIGKLHLAPCEPGACQVIEQRMDDGYQVFDWSHHPCYDAASDQPANAYSRWLRERGRKLEWRQRQDCTHVVHGCAVEDHHTTWCVERAIRFVDDATDVRRPWFCSLNFFDPHHPFDPPDAYLEPYLERLEEVPLPLDRGGLAKTPWEAVDRRNAYGGTAMPGELSDHDHRMVRAAAWAMCDLIDAQVARLFAHMRRIGAFDDTVVIYSSDHGELLGDHGMYLKGPHFYEQSVRVPLVLHGPGLGRMRIDEPVELTDLAPTICELAGLERTPGVQGRSLMPRLRGEAVEHRSDAYCEFMEALAVYRPPAFGSMVRSRRYKLVRFHSPGHEQGLLFDLEDDPQEAHDRWGDAAYAGIRSELMDRLCDRIAMTVDPLPLRHGRW